ncbi:MAG: hypothetical protein HRT61_15045, partial [Ekhidna sp.]|nr:hypothetical protein [Ekhidna sp.]
SIQSSFNNSINSYLGSHRYYFRDDQYIELLVGLGEEFTTNHENLNLANLSTKMAGISYSRPFSALEVRLSAKYYQEGLAYTTRNRIHVEVSIEY